MAYSLETSSVKTIIPGAEVSGFCDVVARQKINEVSGEVPQLSAGEGIDISTVDGKTVITNNISAGQNISLVYDMETNTYRIDSTGGGSISGDYIPYSAAGVYLPNSNFVLSANGRAYQIGDVVTAAIDGNYNEYSNLYDFDYGNVFNGIEYTIADNENKTTTVHIYDGNHNEISSLDVVGTVQSFVLTGDWSYLSFQSPIAKYGAQLISHQKEQIPYLLSGDVQIIDPASAVLSNRTTFRPGVGGFDYSGVKISGGNETLYRGYILPAGTAYTSGVSLDGPYVTYLTGESDSMLEYDLQPVNSEHWYNIITATKSVSDNVWNWNQTLNTVSSNSANWGGHTYTGVAPIQVNNTTDEISITGESLSAGPGIDMFSSGGYVVISSNGGNAFPITGTNGTTGFTANMDCSSMMLTTGASPAGGYVKQTVRGVQYEAYPATDVSASWYNIINATNNRSNCYCIRFTNDMTAASLEDYSAYDKVTVVHSNEYTPDCMLYWDGNTKVFPSGLYCELVKGTNDQNQTDWFFTTSGWINNVEWDWD